LTVGSFFSQGHLFNNLYLKCFRDEALVLTGKTSRNGMAHSRIGWSNEIIKKASLACGIQEN
jgi:hypothetical protein